MSMGNGIYAAEKAGDRISIIFFDEETVQMEKLNRRVKKNIRRKENRDELQRALLREQEQKKAARERARRERLEALVILETKLAAVSIASLTAYGLGLVHPALAWTIIAGCAGIGVYRFGIWKGRRC